MKTIVALSHKSSMTVVAKGIEAQDQADFLHLLECDYGQGYHFGRPMPADRLAEVAATNPGVATLLEQDGESPEFSFGGPRRSSVRQRRRAQLARPRRP